MRRALAILSLTSVLLSAGGLAGEKPVLATEPAKLLQEWRGAKAGFEADASHDVAAVAQLEGRCVQEPMAPNSTVDGMLGGEDCHWGQVTGVAVASWVDTFRLSLDTRGRLEFIASADYDIYLSIHDAGYGPLADGFSVGGADAVAGMTLPAGDYLLLLTTLTDLPGVGGPYQLTSSFQARQPQNACSVMTLVLGQAAADDLQADGCLVFDYLPGVLLDYPAKYFEFTLEEPGRLTASIQSAGFDVRHALMDHRGRTIASDITAEEVAAPTISTLDAPLAAGRYQLLVTAPEGGEGSFTVDSAFDPAGDVCEARRVEADESFTSEITLDGCVDTYLDNKIVLGTPLDIIEVVIVQDGMLDVDVRATGFVPILWLMDTNNQVFIGQYSTPPVTFETSPGTYRIGIQSADGSTGSYDVTLSFRTRIEECDVQRIQTADTVTGDLAASTCPISEYYFGGLDDPVVPYLLTLPERGELVVDLRSDEFDTYLVLLGGPFPTPQGAIAPFSVISDDIDPVTGNTNSQLRLTLPAGEYIVLVTNAIPGEVGTYQLTTSFTPITAPPSCPLTPLNIDQTINGQLDGTECHAFDLDVLRLAPTPVDRYTLEVPARGMVTLFAQSDQFFPRLRLYDAVSGALLAEDYDPGFEAPTAALRFYTTAGTYIVEVESAEETLTRGEYTLAVDLEEVAAPSQCTQHEISAPGYVEGALESGDCLWPDVPGGIGVPAVAPQEVDVYRFTVAEIGAITVTLSSGAFLPYIELLDHRYALRGNDGPPSLDLPAELSGQLLPGDYFLHVLSQDGTEGAYQLAIDWQPSPFDPDVQPTPSPTTPGPTTPGPTATPTAEETAEPRGLVFVPFAHKP